VTPTPEQLDVLLAKARDRALTPAEHAVLLAGVNVLREVAAKARTPVPRRNPIEVPCPLCKAGPGSRCHTEFGANTRGHHKVRLKAAA
jgi:hypothetical protein